MTVPIVLFGILFILMLLVGGKRGVKSFVALCCNFATLFYMVFLIVSKFDPIIVTVMGSMIITSVTLFYINGVNEKTLSAFFSVMVVVFITMLIAYRMGMSAQIQGFAVEQEDVFDLPTYYIHISFAKVVICEMLLGLLGAIIDVAISISSSMNEIFMQNERISKRKLLKSGFNIGKDILGTMTNTLFFAYIGGFMTLIIWFKLLAYSFEQIINSRIFVGEVFQVIAGGVGIIIIIPTTAFLTVMILFRHKHNNVKVS